MSAERLPEQRPELTIVSSTETYERLHQGEEVSWQQIIRENPMLGEITIAQQVNTGFLYVIPQVDAETGTIDFRLIKRELLDQAAPLNERSRQVGNATPGINYSVFEQ